MLKTTKFSAQEK